MNSPGGKSLAGITDPARLTTAIYQTYVAGKPRMDGARAALAQLGIADRAGLAERYAHAKQQRIEAFIAAGSFSAFPDALRLITAVKALGLRLALASSSKNAAAMLRKIVMPSGDTLLALFDADLSGIDLAHGKPDPELFLLAAEALGVAPVKCLVVEDAPSGIAAGVAGGMATLGIARLGDADLLAEAGANLVVTNLDDVEVGALSDGRLRATRKGATEPMRDAFEPTAETNWTLVAEGYDSRRESSVESRFAIGNGFLGVRAARAVSRAAIWVSWLTWQTWASWPRTYVAGLFDAPDTDPPVPALVPVADWSRVRVTLDGERLLLREGETLTHKRTLDMRRGLLLADWRQRAPRGNTARVRTMRLVSLAERSSGLQLLHLEVDGPPAEVTLEATFEGAGFGMEAVRQDQDLGVWRTARTGRILAMAGAARLSVAGRELPPAKPAPLTWRWTWISAPGEAACLTRFVAMARGDTPTDDPAAAVSGALARATSSGWQGVLEAARIRLGRSLVGQRYPRRRRPRGRAGLAVRGLSFEQRGQSGRRARLDRGAGTDGRYLSWPRLLGYRNSPAAVLHHDLARSGARLADVSPPHAGRRPRQGRRRRAGAARCTPGNRPTPARKRRQNGCSSPVGEPIEVLSGKLEQHITADVAYAVWQYWRASGDDAFLRDAGAEILLDTARFWSSRIRMEPDGRGHVRDVVGPDEYHEHVDDNAFTNVMARWNIRRGIEVAGWMRAHWPEYWADLTARLRLDTAELAAWQSAADTLVTGFDAATGLFEQFEGYFRLEDIDLARFADRTMPMDVVIGRDRVQRSMVVKQADVVALLVLLPEEFPAANQRANFDFYASRCGHGSSLSRAMHAVAAARLGDPGLALRYFHDSTAQDLSDATGAAGGVHIAALGGLWQVAVFGFAGLSPRPDALAFDPMLPDTWRSLRFPIRWRGRKLSISVTPSTNRFEAVLRDGPSMRLIVQGNAHDLQPGQTLRVNLQA